MYDIKLKMLEIFAQGHSIVLNSIKRTQITIFSFIYKLNSGIKFIRQMYNFQRQVHDCESERETVHDLHDVHQVFSAMAIFLLTFTQ